MKFKRNRAVTVPDSADTGGEASSGYDRPTAGQKRGRKNPIKIVLSAAAAVIVVAAAVALFLIVHFGPQTGQANQLVNEAAGILSDVSPQINQVDTLLGSAFQQLSQNQPDAEKASLNQAKTLVNQVLPRLNQAKGDIDQAMALNISPAYQDYLQAESTSIGHVIELSQTRLAIAELLLADPTLDKPDSQKKLSGLKQAAAQQSSAAQQAEDQANRIADEHPDEIK